MVCCFFFLQIDLGSSAFSFLPRLSFSPPDFAKQLFFLQSQFLFFHKTSFSTKKIDNLLVLTLMWLIQWVVICDTWSVIREWWYVWFVRYDMCDSWGAICVIREVRYVWFVRCDIHSLQMISYRCIDIVSYRCIVSATITNPLRRGVRTPRGRPPKHVCTGL